MGEIGGERGEKENNKVKMGNELGD